MEKFLNWVKKSHILYLLLIIAMYAVKGVLYFLIAKIPNEPFHFHMAIDDMIPFVKYFYVFYVSYYVLPFILLFYLSFYDKKKFWTLASAASLSNLVAFIVFCFFQVQMIRPAGYDNIYSSLSEALGGFSQVTNVSEFFDACIKMQYFLDAGALNCFPSIHAAFGTMEVLFGIHLFKGEKKIKKGITITAIVFGVGTIVSTLFVKQHYFVDMVAGMVNMILCYVLMHYVVGYITKKKNIIFIDEKSIE